MVLAIKSHKTNSLGLTHTSAISQKNQEHKTITHNDEKLHCYWLWQVVLQYGIFFTKMYGSPAKVH